MQRVIVTGLSRALPQGKLHLGGMHFRCVLGRAGRGIKQREGDGVTPVGCWAIRRIFYRPDREARPRTALPVEPLRPSSGWCDAQGDANYNRFVRLPYPASCERLWRDDSLYDIMAVLGYNDAPRSQGRGSAIFMHVASDGYAPTEGCVALSRRDLLDLLAWLKPGGSVVIL